MREEWLPPSLVDQEGIYTASRSVAALPDLDVVRTLDVFRIDSAGLPWDLGMAVYEPKDPAQACIGADGRKAGIFLLHGGSGDFKDVEAISQLWAGKFGYKVVAATFPGRYYFPDPDGGWPGDTIEDDGARTPLWTVDGGVGRDEYDMVRDGSLRDRYGTRTLARAKPGTDFYHRMAAWPLAFEEGMVAAARRHLPDPEFSVYGEGHSTGGPFIFMLSQRIPNMRGVVAAEHSPFGAICRSRDEWAGPVGKIAGYDKFAEGGARRTDPFDELYIRTWRDLARYAGPEWLGREGPLALMRLPLLMESVLESWETAKSRPQFKAEYIVTHGVEPSLEKAARVTADRLALDEQETEALVARYVGYTRELTGPGVPPVPPVLFGIARDSRDHSPEVYEEVILPAFAAMEPAPKVHVTRFGAGGHAFWKADEGLPWGIAPAVLSVFDDGIRSGYFTDGAEAQSAEPDVSASIPVG
ncbi:MAG: hypothetical protein JWR82_2799 [Blastococcus sp.]|nr:hypothetical protein [Blastococcus sp.]